VSGTTSFFSILSSPKGKAGSVLVSAVQRLSSKSLPDNPVELAALNGLKEGQKIATTGLTGGYLSGTWYYGSGYTGGSAYAVGGFAFGKNALNTNINGSASPSINLLPSYLTFLNKINVRLSSAQIAGNVYYENSFDSYSPFLLASGANPLNTRAVNVLTQSLLKYPSYFKH
jgi:hypothetical protein